MPSGLRCADRFFFTHLFRSLCVYRSLLYLIISNHYPIVDKSIVGPVLLSCLSLLSSLFSHSPSADGCPSLTLFLPEVSSC